MRRFIYCLIATLIAPLACVETESAAAEIGGTTFNSNTSLTGVDTWSTGNVTIDPGVTVTIDSGGQVTYTGNNRQLLGSGTLRVGDGATAGTFIHSKGPSPNRLRLQPDSPTFEITSTGILQFIGPDAGSPDQFDISLRNSSQMTVASGGQINVDLDNAAVIRAITGSGDLTLNSGAAFNLNTGTFRYQAPGSSSGDFNVGSDGTLEFRTDSGHNYAGATASGNGVVEFRGSDFTVDGGTFSLETLGNNQFVPDDDFISVDNGGIFAIQGGANLTFDGGDDNVGNRINGDGTLQVGGTGAGTLTHIHSRLRLFEANSTLHVMSNGTLDIQGDGLGNDQIGANAAGTSILIEGLLQANLDSPATTKTVFANAGATTELAAGATVDVQQGTLNLTGAGDVEIDGTTNNPTLTGVTLRVQNDSTLNIDDRVDFTTIGAGGTIDMRGAASSLEDAGNNLLDSLDTVASGGSLLTSDGFDFTPAGGTLTVDGVLGGNSAGVGGISGDVNVGAGGVVSPGLSDIGQLDVDGNVDLLGTLLVEVTPTAAGDADFFNVSGDLDISGGTLDIDALGVLDDPSYLLAQYGTLTGGVFASVVDLPTGYAVDYNFQGGNTIALVQSSTVIPEPSGIALWLLIGLTLAGFGYRCRRKK